jgi:serine/threonine protein kinase/tetratricopeptide (TPR) repeat protein
MSADFQRVKEIFLSAVEKPSPAEREAYLVEACGDDAALREQVEALLRRHVAAGSFLSEPAVARPIATVDYEPLAEGPGAIIGPYKLLQKIGEGGFGVVYMAEQAEPIRRMVALKIIKPGMESREVIARFEAERQALALMDHPNIAKVLDAGTVRVGQDSDPATPAGRIGILPHSGRPYFVMELVKGVPITEFCDKNHLPPEARLKLFIHVCHAIQHAHHKGVIHRDIKPSNVLVTLHDGQPVVKVIDFGVAKAIAQKLTEKTLFTAFGQIVGSPAYMSPEQAEMSGLDIDTRSDIFSLGVLLYELLTGTTPLENRRLREAGYAEMQRLIREEEAPRPSTRLSSLGESATVLAGNRGLDAKRLVQLLAGDLDWVVMKALEKDRNRRYATPGHFAEDVERYLRRDAIVARPPSTIYKVKKFVQRNRAGVLTAAGIAAVLVAGTAVATWQAIRARRAEAIAREERWGTLWALSQMEEERARAVAAAAAEKAAKEAAQAREAESKSVLEFVENKVIAAARPEGQEGGLGHDVTLRRAVETAVPFVAHSFADQPLNEARLRLTLGVSFFYLGDAQAAAEQYEAARALCARHLGPDNFLTLRCMNNLANSYAVLGRNAEAATLYEETLSRRKARFGPTDPETLRSMNGLANSYHLLGRHVEALKLREETLALRRTKLGPEHPDTLMSMYNLANSYEALGRIAEAFKLREETLVLRQTKLGRDHPDTLMTMDALAVSLDALGRHAEALKLREETLALKKAKLGPEHPDTLRTMNDLAISYDRLGRSADALKVVEESFARLKAKLGPDHPVTLKSAATLAVAYGKLRRHADAARLFEETLMLNKAKLGPEHPDTLINMTNLAISYAHLGRRADAVKLLDEALALHRTKLGADHPDTLAIIHNLAQSYADVGRYADALKLFDETLARLIAKLGADHPDTLISMWGKAGVLVKLDRGAEAIPVIDECVQRAAGKIVDPRMLPRLLDLRLRHFEKMKDASGCRRTAEVWEKLNRTDAASLYAAARMRSVTCAVCKETTGADAIRLADEEADRAVAWLTQAVAAGYKDAAHMAREKDLDALRDREDFKKLMAALAVDQKK